MGYPIQHIVGFDGETYDIPTSGGSGAVRIYYNSSSDEWLDYNTDNSIYALDIGTIVWFEGGELIDLSQDSSKLVLKYPYKEEFRNYDATNDMTNYKYLDNHEAFVGVIVGNDSTYDSTIVMRIDADCAHFPSNILSSMGNFSNDDFETICTDVRDSIGSALVFEGPGQYAIPHVYQSDGSTEYTVFDHKRIGWANGYSAYVFQIDDDLRDVPIKVKGYNYGRLIAATYGGITTNYIVRESHDTYSLTVPSSNSPALVLWYGPN